MSDLNSTPVSKCLDKKSTIAGFEVADLFVIFLTMSVLNLTLGWTGQRLLLVWLPSIALACVIRFSKRGKPDGYLLHLLKFKIAQKYFSAFPDARGYQAPPSVKSNEVNA